MNFKKLFIVFIIIILLIIGIYYLFIMQRKYENKIIENQIVQNQIEVSEKEANYKQEDEEKPEDIEDVKLDDTNKVLGCMVLGEFNNSGVLSDEDLLKVVYTLIDSNVIKIENDMIKSDEVNNIVYSIFNRKMSEFVSIENMQFNDENYNVKRKNKNYGNIENDEISVAMGKVYMVCDYNGNHYIIRFATNTLTGEKYIQAINKK